LLPVPARPTPCSSPCGHTLASVCLSCAERGRTLRAAQCREGWHLEDEPDIEADPATTDQKWWIEKRAETQQLRDQAATTGQDTTDLDELIGELDEDQRGGHARQGCPGRADATAPLHPPPGRTRPAKAQDQP
jgi:hypothetical protein